MSDLRDPEYAERFAYEAPDEYLRRREFLQRTALTAGLASGLATVLAPDVLVAEAGKRQHRGHFPSPRNMPIDTFVVLMMENRSFDHYLGWLPHADGHQAGLKYADKHGQKHATHALPPDFQGCAFNDPDHSWEGGRTQLAGGRMNGFLKSGDNDVFSIGYYREQDLPFTPHAARASTTFDRFFCSLLASTYPNREYMHAAQSYGNHGNQLPGAGFQNQGFPDTTIFAALSAKGISNRYFFSDIPASALWGQKGVARSSRVDEYYARCQTGTLPAVSFVDPSFANEGGGTSGDEHPHGDVHAGQGFVSEVVHAFMSSPHWKRGVIFMVYDEWGGFFDHVRPPKVPDIRESRDLSKDFGQMGFRIPAVALSPYLRRGHVDHGVWGFESILKMIEYKFGLAPLTRRDAYAHNIARSFDWVSKPRLTPPNLPTAPTVLSAQCSNRTPSPVVAAGASQSKALERPKPHDMVNLLTSGYLDRIGFHYRPATPEILFREPHKAREALAGNR